MKKSWILLVMLGLSMALLGCEESEEGVDDNNDIIIRNFAEDDLWIRIDGSPRGHIENNGIAETMWDGIGDGFHYLEAFWDDQYTDFHCDVSTDYLDDGEDFLWYLREDDRYDGTKEGDC